MVESWEHSSCEWTRGGCGRRGVVGADIQIRMRVLKVGLLSVMTSSFDHVNIWSADQ